MQKFRFVFLKYEIRSFIIRKIILDKLLNNNYKVFLKTNIKILVFEVLAFGY
jgi:hypothetical protein